MDASGVARWIDYWSAIPVFFCPEVFYKSYWFLLYFIVVMAVFLLVRQLVFARDLKGLQRAQVELRPRLFYGQTSQRHSKTGLVFGFVGSVLFVAAGIWILCVGMNYAVGILCVSFFGLCAVAWGYALYLKMAK
jgi:hypothetical protein